jgi:beta-lactam-binding protein with PASTA domain
MPRRTFSITRPQDSVVLDAMGHGKVPFTITNETDRAIKSKLLIRPDNPEDASMMQVEGGPERNFRPKDTQNINVLIAAPKSAGAGQRKFFLKAVDVEAPDDNYEDSQSVTFNYVVPQNGRKIPWALIIIIAVVVIGGGIFAWRVISGRGVTIADYTGAKFDDVSAQLKDEGLLVQKAEEVNDPGKPAGVIESQTLKKGTTAKKGDTIAFVVTAQTLRVPRVKGQTIEEARSNLANAGFVIDKAIKTVNQTTTDPTAVGRVIAEDPDPDKGVAALPASGPIMLTMGVGPELASVPPLVGHARCEATKTLSDRGFNADVQYNPAAPGANDSVVTQIPPGGDSPKGSKVTLVIAGNTHLPCYRFLNPLVYQRLQLNQIK